jgi:polar amino acid transport system substrate-binding protein
MIENRIAELLAKEGTIRAAINLGNPLLAWRAEDGGLQGPSVDIAYGIAKALEVDLHLVAVDHARLSVDLLREGKADLGFLAVDPGRAEHLAFSEPYLSIEGGYLAPVNTELQTAGEVDRPSIRIAASRGSAYDLHLQRNVRNAMIISTSSFEESLGLLEAGSVDVAAGIRQAFPSMEEGSPWRILVGSFMEIRQAICVPRQNDDAIGFLNDYLTALVRDGASR